MNKKQIAAIKASKFIKDNTILGLGTGSTAAYLVEEVGKLVEAGYTLKCVCTSFATEKLAKENNIPILGINEVDHIDLGIDGVDEIDPNFNAIKGGGGALLREKVVATLAKEVVWIMDNSKIVDKIGGFPLPIEIIPFGYKHTVRALEAFNPVLRIRNDEIFITDNGNYILDLHLGKGFNIENIKTKLNETVGVVETGLFLKMSDRIVVGTDDGAKVIIK